MNYCVLSTTQCSAGPPLYVPHQFLWLLYRDSVTLITLTAKLMVNVWLLPPCQSCSLRHKCSVNRLLSPPWAADARCCLCSSVCVSGAATGCTGVVLDNWTPGTVREHYECSVTLRRRGLTPGKYALHFRQKGGRV